MTAVSLSPRKQLNAWFQWGLVLLMGLGGFILGVLVVIAWSSGWLNFWHRLPSPPETAVRLMGATLHSVDVETADGRLYRLELKSKGQQWMEVTATLTQTAEDCDFFARRALPLNSCGRPYERLR